MTTHTSAATSDRTETDATRAQVEIGDLAVVAPAPPRPRPALPGTVCRPLTRGRSLPSALDLEPRTPPHSAGKSRRQPDVESWWSSATGAADWGLHAPLRPLSLDRVVR